QFDIKAIKPLERQLLELLMVLIGRNIAISGKNGVARVVMVTIELHKIVITQINNVIRLTATVVVVCGGRKQVAGQVLPQLGSWSTHGALHLVVNHAPVYQITGGIVRLIELKAMAFLGKIQGIKLGKKHRIQINRQQIVEILAIHAGKRIGGPVTAGEGVHKGIQRTPDHHEERIAHRIPFTATQSGVLKNVGNAGGVHREGSQGYKEDVFIVIRRQVQVARTGFLVAILFHLKVKGTDPV